MSYTIKSVDKALSMLEAFSELEGGVNLTRLSEKLELNKSGVYRLLQVLKRRGYVEQPCQNGKYQLGNSAIRLSQNIMSNYQLLNLAKPFMESLVKEYNETVYLVLNCKDHVLFFDQVDSINKVNVMSLKGRGYPVEKIAAGLVQKAFDTGSPEMQVNAVTVDGESYARVRQQGYSTDQNQLGEGVVSFAVPLLAARNEVVASLCLVGPDFRLTSHKSKAQLLAPLLSAGRDISIKLGYSDPQGINL